MTLLRKLKASNIIVGEIYVAFSAKNKMLSSNADRGRFVLVTNKSATDLKVKLLGTEIETKIANFDKRKDAWVYDPKSAPIPIRVNANDPDEFPKFTPRMVNEGWNTKVFPFNSNELYTSTREGKAGFGITLLRHKGDTIKPETGEPYINNFRASWLLPTEAPEWHIPRSERMGLGAVELPLPKKPVPPEHEAVLEMLMPLIKKVKSSHTRDNVTFMQVSKDGKENELYRNQACHRQIQKQPDFEIGYVITLGSSTVKTSWVKGHPFKEAQYEYVNYLVNHSPYADAFITKDPEFILKYGYVLDASAPNRILVGACFATRQEWEKPFRAEAYYEFLKAGLVPDVAFIFGSQCSQYKDGKIKFGLTSGDHNFFQNGHASDKCLLNFIKHTPQFAGKPYSEDVHASSGTTGGVDGMWSKDFHHMSRVNTSKIHQQLLEIKKYGGDPTNNALPIEEAVDIACGFIEDWCAANGIESNVQV